MTTSGTTKTSQDAIETARLINSSASKEVEEVVERLEDCLGGLDTITAGAISDAADLLTRLSAERDRLEGERDSLLPDDPWHWKNRAIKAEAERDALKARVAEVLEPFAKAAQHIVHDDRARWHPDLWSEDIKALTVGHFRRAAELHATLSGERT